MGGIKRLLALCLVVGWAGNASALPVTFGFAFDNVFNSLPLEPPMVGTGQVSFDDIGNGTFSLSSLTNLSMQFSIAGQSFSLADADTPLGQVLAVVTHYGTGRRLQFSNSQGFGSGPHLGSIDFTNDNGAFLTFQPPGYGPSLDLYLMSGAGTTVDGSYLATTGVPLPGTLALVATALLPLLRGRAAVVGRK